MRLSNESHQHDWFMPPMEAGVTDVAAGAAQVIVDLTTMSGTPAKAALTIAQEDWNPNPTGHYLWLQPDGQNIYVTFGPTFASLAALNPAAVTAVNGATGALATTSTAGGVILLVNGSWYRFKLPTNEQTRDNADVGLFSPARFIGFIAPAGACVLRMFQVSP